MIARPTRTNRQNQDAAASSGGSNRGLAGHRRRVGTAVLILIAAGAVLLAIVVALVPDHDRAKVSADPGPRHVHALAVNPSDDSLFLASHTGLYRIGRDETSARRVGDRHQDTMGFTIVGPDRFLGSGHPRFARQPSAPPWPDPVA